MRSLLIAAAIFAPQIAYAWTCENKQLEITCDRKGCSGTTPTDGFTPMGITVSERGQFSACAYSGCWEGRASTIQRSKRYLYLSGRFRWSGTSHGRAELAALIDRKNRTAVFMGEGFVNPMTCSLK
jgi:hypothetical protein